MTANGAVTSEKTILSLFVFDEAYQSRTPPWVIGEPLPAIAVLERDGWIRGTVFDPGCGTGEHTIHLTGSATTSVASTSWRTRSNRLVPNAAEHKVAARFEVADAL